jgi:hypothetical protein
MRAAVINWLFGVANNICLQDLNTLHQAVALIDIYYEKELADLPPQDLQLTTVTAFFIQSKSIEVEPIDLGQCRKQLCHRKFT